jgi:transposase
MLNAMEPIKRPISRQRKRPDELDTDKAYDASPCRAECWTRGITPRIARCGIESSEKFGRPRWVAERTLAWSARLRRLRARDERLAERQIAFLQLGCALILLNVRVPSTVADVRPLWMPVPTRPPCFANTG